MATVFGWLEERVIWCLQIRWEVSCKLTHENGMIILQSRSMMFRFILMDFIWREWKTFEQTDNRTGPQHAPDKIRIFIIPSFNSELFCEILFFFINCLYHLKANESPLVLLWYILKVYDSITWSLTPTSPILNRL